MADVANNHVYLLGYEIKGLSPQIDRNTVPGRVTPITQSGEGSTTLDPSKGCHRGAPAQTPIKVSQWEHLFGSPHRLMGVTAWRVWDMLWVAGEEHFRIVQNLQWDV